MDSYLLDNLEWMRREPPSLLTLLACGTLYLALQFTLDYERNPVHWITFQNYRNAKMRPAIIWDFPGSRRRREFEMEGQIPAGGCT
jgi:hypothetical protein